MNDQLNSYISDIKQGYGWVTVQYIFNQYDFLTHRELHTFLHMLIDQGMLVDERELYGDEECVKMIPERAFVTYDTFFDCL
tara:strand:- start:564 stop:806 length:243 start_codon:yes stop_codon:yes gene_type:complete